MEISMGIRGKRFVKFVRAKLRQRKGEIDGFKDIDFSRELGVEYDTLKRWLKATEVDRLDLDNLFVFVKKYPDEFIRFMEQDD